MRKGLGLRRDNRVSDDCPMPRLGQIPAHGGESWHFAVDNGQGNRAHAKAYRETGSGNRGEDVRPIPESMLRAHSQRDRRKKQTATRLKGKNTKRLMMLGVGWSDGFAARTEVADGVTSIYIFGQVPRGLKIIIR